MARRLLHSWKQLEVTEKHGFQSSEDLCERFRKHSLAPGSPLAVVAAILKQGLPIKVESWIAPVPEWPMLVPVAFEQNPAIPSGTSVTWTRFHGGTLWLRANFDGKKMVCLVDAGKECFARYMQNAIDRFETWMLIKLSYTDPSSHLYILAGPDQLASVLWLYTLV